MTALDTRLIPKVALLIARLGKKVIFKVRTAGTYNPSTRAVDSETITSYTPKVTPPEMFKESMVNGDTILSTDLRVWLPVKDGKLVDIGFTPAPGQIVTIDLKDYTIVAVENVYTGELIALYGVQLR